MPTKFDRLQAKLAELFQLDRGDLDFGIYRIMNLRREEISRFLNEELLPQVRTALAGYQPAERGGLETDLRQAEVNARALGMDPVGVPRVQQLRERLAAYGVDLGALEDEIYSHLYDFFSRYYDEGDFISMRRYKEGVYAIPYEGEEVKLHWANADQYYVKIAENFRDYTFRLPSGRCVHFKLSEAEADRDNVKGAGGNDRRFIFVGVAAVPDRPAPDELVIRFEYRADPDKRKQAEISSLAAAAILAQAPADWAAEMGTPAPTEANPRRTLLDKHLAGYSARNTFDYFIHKDLRGFLRRELDFYIKNEVMRLDDIEDESAPRVEAYLGKVRALRQVAHKIIDFLAQIEELQKRLWLKKKFVVETNYCVTLDRVPEALYAEIAANDAQRAEWVRLFAIDEITESTVTPGYSVPLTAAVLKAHPFLVLDTRFFDGGFRDRLVSSFDDLDGQTDGLLVQSENFQALRLLSARYREQVKCIYIDPPYNTSGSEIVYKNAYKHSSWLSLIADRIIQGLTLASHDAIQCVAIDDAETPRLSILLETVFGPERYLATVVLRSKPQGRAVPSGFSPNHEYAVFYGVSADSNVGRLPRDEKRIERYGERDTEGFFSWANFRKTGAASTRSERPKLFYPIFVSNGAIFIPRFQWDDNRNAWIPLEDPPSGSEAVYPLDDNGVERVWSFGWDRAQRESASLLTARKLNDKWQIYRKYRPNQEGILPGTWWGEARYSASENGTKVLRDILGGQQDFSYPKSIFSVIDCLRACNLEADGTVLDYFAGSGTTAHATMVMNQEDGGDRRYILVEMGQYFGDVLKPRIQRIAYAAEWRDGKPVMGSRGQSHSLKYLRLESYEDTLNNLAFRPRVGEQMALAGHPEFREDYTLHYMLDAESRDSLLNVAVFEDPFGYTLDVASGIVGETRPVVVDLVETFNYLLGLRVRHVDAIQGYRVVQGANPQGERVLVIWRNLKEKSNADLEAFFRKQDYNPRDMEFDLTYVNGDNHLENLRRPDETWKVRLIEEEFLRLMFDVEDV